MTAELLGEYVDGEVFRVTVTPPLGARIVFTVRPRIRDKHGNPRPYSGEKAPRYVVIAGTHEDPETWISKHTTFELACRSGLYRAKRYLNSYKRLARQKAKK